MLDSIILSGLRAKNSWDSASILYFDLQLINVALFGSLIAIFLTATAVGIKLDIKSMDISSDETVAGFFSTLTGFYGVFSFERDLLDLMVFSSEGDFYQNEQGIK